MTFRLLVVPGVTMDKWNRMWIERRPDVRLELVPADRFSTADEADAGLVRLPVDPDAWHAIPLYTETTVVIAPRDHVVAAADTVTLADLAGLSDDALLHPLDDSLAWPGGSPVAPPTAPPLDRPATTAAAVELVAAGVGLLVVPQSLARLHHRRDLIYRPVTDAPTSSVALVWPRDGHTDLVEEMIGIVRGRTANSTRGRTEPPAKTAAPPRRSPGRPGTRTPPPRRRGR